MTKHSLQRPLLRGRIYPDHAETGDMPLYVLIYSLFIFLLPLLTGSQGIARWGLLTFWGATVVAYLIFLRLYFQGWWLRDRQLFKPIIGIAALGLLLLPINTGAQMMIVYAAAFAARLESLRMALLSLAALSAVFLLLAAYLGLPMLTLSPNVLAILAVFSVNRFSFDSERRRALLQLSQNEVAQLAQSAERNRIAADLHDLLGHTLSLVALKAELARKLVSRAPAQAEQELAELEAIARNSLQEVRRTVHGLHSAEFSVELAKSRLVLGAADMQLHSDIAELRLPAAVEAVLASALREAINNVVRHSKARVVRIRLCEHEHAAVLNISDDGRARELPREGFGLRMLRQRINDAGGTLTLECTQGLTLELRLPLPTTAASLDRTSVLVEPPLDRQPIVEHGSVAAFAQGASK